MRQVAQIFSKAVGTNKLYHFSEVLCTQHRHVPHLRGGAVDELEKEPTDKAKGRAEEDVESTGRPSNRYSTREYIWE